jgi:hypothetical protein
MSEQRPARAQNPWNQDPWNQDPWNQDPWFASVAVARRPVRKRLPQPVYAAQAAGSERGLTTTGNEAAFGRPGLSPHARAHLWGPAAKAHPGVENVPGIMRFGADSALTSPGPPAATGTPPDRTPPRACGRPVPGVTSRSRSPWPRSSVSTWRLS